MCSAKEKKGLNKVFHTAFKVVFQMKSMDKNRAGGGAAGATQIDPRPPGAIGDPNRKPGGCCGSKKK